MVKIKVRHAIGIDFGGTYIKMALVSERGEIVAHRKIPTKDAKTVEDWLDAAASGMDYLMEQGDVLAEGFAGIGVGVPGFVDFSRGFIYNLTNVPGWDSVNLADMLENRFGIRARVDNDVNAMTLGESTYGAGRAYQHAVFVTLGTGVGGGIILNNRMYRGAHSMAGEIGHISVDMNGPKSRQGRGGVELFVGNSHIVERTVKELEAGRSSIIEDLVAGDRSKITPKVIVQAAKKGDALAKEIFDVTADCLATAFASVTYLIQPQAFIVGGGVAQAGHVLFDPLKHHLSERLDPFFAERITVKHAELGNDAGVIGAATLVFME